MYGHVEIDMCCVGFPVMGERIFDARVRVRSGRAARYGFVYVGVDAFWLLTFDIFAGVCSHVLPLPCC